MPLTPQLNNFLLCPICFNQFSTQRKPFTLLCSHTCCSNCLQTIQSCPFDSTPIESQFPENEAILGLVATNGGGPTNASHSLPSNSRNNDQMVVQNYDCVDIQDIPYYRKCIDCVKQMALLLRPQQQNQSLSRPMQRKLITLLHCQIVEGEGRTRALRNVRSIGERALAELLVKHQDSHQLSTNLWAAVRARGCQFLGPAMQEEVLRLVLLALEDGSALSRKVLVMFVVQRLSPHYHQASKTAIGHVIQLLYRASCFKLTKRDGDSSLMQLKEEYCCYDALRREHDTQIVSIALEAGLRISPDQWSSLLYGDSHHKSHMQSIIDKLQSPASFAQSIQEFIIALQRTGDPSGLAVIKNPLERLAMIDPNPTNVVTHPSLEELSDALECAKSITFQLIEFLQRFGPPFNTTSNNTVNTRNKMTPNACPNGNQRQRVGRVRPLMSEQSISPQFNSEPFSASLSQLVPQALPPLQPIQTVIRPCASVPPQRIIRATNVQVSPGLAMGPMSGPPPHSLLTQTDDSQSTHLISMPVLVTSTPSTPPLAPSMMGCDMSPTLSEGPSTDDPMIPFSDRPFVSKYGPVRSKFGLNLINTPTMSGSQQSTQPTNVILGRSAVPSLTLIQPLQILTTAFLTDPNSNSQYGSTAFIADPTYQNTYLSTLMDLESGDHINGLNG